MATKTLRIYATSASDGKHPDEKMFGVSYYRSDTAYSVSINYVIPDYIKSYRLKSFNLNVIDFYNTTDFNIAGDYSYFDGSSEPLERGKEILHITKVGQLIINGDTTKTIVKNSLSWTLDWRYQSDYAFFHGTNADDENNRPFIEIEVTEPEISNISISGSSTDDIVTASWDSTDVVEWNLNVSLDNAQIATASGTSDKTATFSVGTFTQSGEYEFKLTAINGCTKEYIVNHTINTVSPIISNVEPSNVNMLRTSTIPITFTGTNIDSWSLAVEQTRVTKHTDSGTTGRTSTIQPNVLSNGTAIISITATHNGTGYTTTTTKEVTFTAYGKPEAPTLNISTSYSTPKPLLQWIDSSEQVAYRVVINHGEEVVSDVSAYGNDSAYQVTDLLLNNNIYSVSVYIKNQYDLWSDPVSASFSISFAELESPVFTLYNDDDNAMNVLVIESPVSEEFYYHEVYRREKDTTTWSKIADNVNRVQTIKDNECRSNTLYEYKVSAVSSLGTYTDSEIKECSCNFHNTHINVANSDQKVILNMEVSSDVTYEDDINFEVYDGINKPGSSSGLLDYATLSISCQLKEADFYKIMAFWKESLLCIRDASGLLLYGRISKPKYSYYLGRYQTSFTFTETYNEGVNMNGNDESRFNCFIESEW